MVALGVKSRSLVRELRVDCRRANHVCSTFPCKKHAALSPSGLTPSGLPVATPWFLRLPGPAWRRFCQCQRRFFSDLGNLAVFRFLCVCVLLLVLAESFFTCFCLLLAYFCYFLLLFCRSVLIKSGWCYNLGAACCWGSGCSGPGCFWLKAALCQGVVVQTA